MDVTLILFILYGMLCYIMGRTNFIEKIIVTWLSKVLETTTHFEEQLEECQDFYRKTNSKGDDEEMINRTTLIITKDDIYANKFMNEFSSLHKGLKKQLRDDSVVVNGNKCIWLKPSYSNYRDTTFLRGHRCSCLYLDLDLPIEIISMINQQILTEKYHIHNITFFDSVYDKTNREQTLEVLIDRLSKINLFLSDEVKKRVTTDIRWHHIYPNKWQRKGEDIHYIDMENRLGIEDGDGTILKTKDFVTYYFAPTQSTKFVPEEKYLTSGIIMGFTNNQVAIKNEKRNELDFVYSCDVYKIGKSKENGDIE